MNNHASLHSISVCLYVSTSNPNLLTAHFNTKLLPSPKRYHFSHLNYKKEDHVKPTPNFGLYPFAANLFSYFDEEPKVMFIFEIH
jgi:hypothetical protein